MRTHSFIAVKKQLPRLHRDLLLESPGSSLQIAEGAMRVLILHSPKDKAAGDRVSAGLARAGHEIVDYKRSQKRGRDWAEGIVEALKQSEAVVLLMSNAALSDTLTAREFSGAVLVGQDSSMTRPVFPALLERVQVPSYLANRLYVDLSEDFSAGLKKIAIGLTALSRSEPGSDQVEPDDGTAAARRRQINRLGAALHSGRLTLVCGAGVSVAAGIPAWNELLYRLLKTALANFTTVGAEPIDRELAVTLQSNYSALVMGRYLKNNLGTDFLPAVRGALYQGNPSTGPVIDAIVRLSRPERDGEPLDSIITFNFDALLEEQLSVGRVVHRPVYSEGIRVSPSELPVYHVHGYLPRSGTLPANTDIVFSEDAYHSQFIDSFSWSNLVQLQKLTENTCLLIGISLSDPNLRRLLDVAQRKANGSAPIHFLIKKVPVARRDGSVDDIIRLLEEQDANALGLNMIWVDEFDDIPKVLDDIIAVRNREYSESDH